MKHTLVAHVHNRGDKRQCRIPYPIFSCPWSRDGRRAARERCDKATSPFSLLDGKARWLVNEGASPGVETMRASGITADDRLGRAVPARCSDSGSDLWCSSWARGIQVYPVNRTQSSECLESVINDHLRFIFAGLPSWPRRWWEVPLHAHPSLHDYTVRPHLDLQFGPRLLWKLPGASSFAETKKKERGGGSVGLCSVCIPRVFIVAPG